MNPIKKYRSIPYERRIIYTATVTMSISSVIAAGKILIGVFSDLVMCAVGVFNILLVIAKLSCVLGVIQNKGFKPRNTFTAVFLFFAGLVYVLYMGASLIFEIPQKEYTRFMSIMTAAIAFTEMGVAIYGLIRTKRKGHYYRNIKIISFVSALTALMTAQIALLSFFHGRDLTVSNSYSGMGLGIITMLIAAYVYFAPQLSTIGREHNVFICSRPQENKLIDMSQSSVEITLCKSKIYGDYIYRAEIDGNKVDGNIVKAAGIFRRMHLALKIICIILSEILVFAWLAGYAVYFVRTADMPTKLKKKMRQNGFDTIPPNQYTVEENGQQP